MNTHKEPRLEIGSRFEHKDLSWVVTGISVMGDSIQYYVKNQYTQETAVFQEEDLELAPLKDKEEPRELYTCNNCASVDFKKGENQVCFNCGKSVEPTPPSQIEEGIKSSFEQGYELGLEHGRELALKDIEILSLEKDLEAIKQKGERDE